MNVIPTAGPDAGISAWTIQTTPVASVLIIQAPGKDRRGTSVARPQVAQVGIHLNGKTPINSTLERLRRKAKAKRNQRAMELRITLMMSVDKETIDAAKASTR